MRIYVAGHRGMVGRAVSGAIEKDPNHDWVGHSREELDLLDRKKVFQAVNESGADAVVIAAARVGGILENSRKPVEFLSENIQIQTNLIDASHEADISRLVFLGSSCIYPKFAPQPMKPPDLMTGHLEPTNSAYAMAKLAGLELVKAYRRQHDRRWISLLPTNLYGPYDNYDPTSSHVIPGIISKFLSAKQIGSNSVELWGSGRPLREFLHVQDLASATLHALENYDNLEPLNVGSGEEVSISELATIIKKLVGFEGRVLWDSSKPDGTPRKLLDSSALFGLGWRPKISLEQGLKSTIESMIGN